MSIIRAFPLFVVLTCSLSLAQNFSERAKAICDVLEANHIEPKPFDTDFSNFVFDQTITALDPNHQVLLAPNLKSLADKHRNSIHNEISDGYVQFLDDLYFHFKIAINHTDSTYTSFIDYDLDFSKIESYRTVDSDGLDDFPTNKTEQRNTIRKYIKKRVLDRGYELHTEEEFIVQHLQLTNDVIQNTQCGYQHILGKPQEIRHLVETCFNDAIVAYFDPHSSYFSYHQKKLFEAMLSTSEETFGIHISQKDNGQYYVSDLIAGGQAWKSNLIHEDDEITALSIDEKPFNLGCTSIQFIYRELTDPSSKKLYIKVKNTERKDVEMNLVKEVLKVDDNTIKSFVLHGDQTIGYISIPSFYTDFEGSEGTKGVAEDVAKEILKIKRENIDGLIIDLRFNGGGSVREAIELTGLFIPDGPIGIMESTGMENPYIMTDTERGQIFDGPMAIMINRYSASASEILAGALQDYNRAIIVGSRSYGKGSGQSTYFVDQYEQRHDYGYLKITDTRLYRVDGTSNQLRGVLPDIELSDLWVYDGIGEDENMNALSEIKKGELARPFTAFNPLPLEKLRLQSTSRTDLNVLSSVDSIGNYLGRLYNQKEIPLNFNSYWSFWNHTASEYQTSHTLFEQKSTNYTIKNNEFDKFLIQLDPKVKKENDNIINDMQHDPYIQETYFILKDYTKTINE